MNLNNAPAHHVNLALDQRQAYDEHLIRLYQDVEAMVGNAGTVRYRNTESYGWVSAQFKYTPAQPIAIDCYINAIRERAGDDAYMKVTGETDDRGRISLRITMSYDKIEK